VCSGYIQWQSWRDAVLGKTCSTAKAIAAAGSPRHKVPKAKTSGAPSNEYCSDVLHPNRANVSKDELRQKLAEMYKANKDQVSCFGFRTQFGGGKSTGFALIYDSVEALKKFEPQYRLVRYGKATKPEKASRQQRMLFSVDSEVGGEGTGYDAPSSTLGSKRRTLTLTRQAAQESRENAARHGKGQGRQQGQEEEVDVDVGVCGGGVRRMMRAVQCGGTRLCHWHWCVYWAYTNAAMALTPTLILHLGRGACRLDSP
jgi:ribosomal protein S24E